MFTKEDKREIEEGIGDVSWLTVKLAKKLVVILVLVVLAGFGLNLMYQPLALVTKTFNADNIIYNYEWFHQASNDIYAAEKAITLTEKSIASLELKYKEVKVTEYPMSVNTQFNRLNTNLNGQEIYFQQLLSDFRARSSMVNRSIFKGDSKIIRWVDYKLN